MNRKAFFDALRADPLIFTRGIRQNQVDGIENLLNVAEKYMPDMALDEISYNFATAYWETGQTMQPITELGAKSYFNKYEPGTKLGERLGNTQPGDGWKFRGEGHVQNTGRRNAAFSSKQLNKQFGLHTDFEHRPDERGNPLYSALCLFFGNRQGWWTGKKLTDFLDGIDESDREDIQEFIKSRRVVNGIDKAEVIAQIAISFERAFKRAGYTPKVTHVQEVLPLPVPVQPKPIAEALAPVMPQPANSWWALFKSVFFNR